MGPTRSFLGRLIALLLLLQWSGAVLPHARAMAALGRAMAVELCSPSGMRTVLVDEAGAPLKPAPDSMCCDLCGGPPALAVEDPQVLSRPVAHTAARHDPARPGLPRLPPRAPPGQPRAPPAA
ncbi:DUF2946 family protein [Roseomonas sp. GCM10028921]